MGPKGQYLQDRMVQNSYELIKYFAVNMENMKNFNYHLQKILIPRVPGTSGSYIVRKVSSVLNLAQFYVTKNDVFINKTIIM